MIVAKNIRPLISVILSSYNEERNIPLLYERLSSVASEMPEYDFEFMFVDDCSNDKTPDILAHLRKADHRVVIIRFARNCGSHAADSAGLHFCRGNVAIIMAADLQDPPEVIIPGTIEQWGKGYKVVWGVREKRKGESFITIFLSRVYYYLMNLLTDIKQPPTGADVFLLDRVVIDAFKQSPEKHSSNMMLIAWLGFSQTSITYVKEARHAGHSKWTISKKIKLSLDSLISFSYVPLKFMSLMGVISAFLGLLYGGVVLINAFRGNPVQGWSSLMIVILVLGGFQMSMMGMLGEYLWRTYDESRGRPRYVIEKNTLLDNTSNDSNQEKDDKD
ncbi:MAG: glycosyltransferase family 2 protein [Thermodesulfobacteriota bacterium]|nr:glycosyltransferase family 2 protein [Thermodesulfobacteriota bacterium]